MRDVVIAGGGFVGLVTAAALAREGADVTVLEALEGPNPAFRGELIHPRGVRALEALDLLAPLLDAGGVRVRGFAAFAPHANEPVLLPYPDRERQATAPADRASPGATGIALDHHQMVATLRRRLAEWPRVTIHRGIRATEVVRERGRAVGLSVEHGTEHRAALVVLADGRHSRLRRSLGLATTTELLSHSVALSVDADALVDRGYGHVFVDAPGPTLAYPCGGDRVRMCIDVPAGAAKGDAALRALLRERYAPGLPNRMRDAMLRALDGGALAGAANHAVSTRVCAFAGGALVGDAGGCSHPITATGMTTGLHDALTLAACVGRHGVTDASLADYQRRRYRFVRAREAFTSALYDVLRGATPGTLALRDGLFAYWTGSERARATSMAILCGDDDRVATFAAEYVRVVAGSTGRLVAEGLARRDAGSTLSRLRALFDSAGGALNVALAKAASTLALERTRAVDGLTTTGRRSLLRGAHRGTRQRGPEDLDDRAAHARVPVRGGDVIEQP